MDLTEAPTELLTLGSASRSGLGADSRVGLGVQEAEPWSRAPPVTGEVVYEAVEG